jgi:1-acyl-sn-glycerol-3-phosphate acyltransferase
MKYFAKFYLWATGWKIVSGKAPVPKCICLGVPHTSLWDFVISWLFYVSVGGKSNIVVNKKFFFFPVGYLLRYMGAIPVDTSRGASLVKQIVSEFKNREILHLAIAPEATRKPATKWKGGFHTIARAANVPVFYAIFDWKNKEVGILDQVEITDDLQADMLKIKQWYKNRGVGGKHPEKFVLGDGLD